MSISDTQPIALSVSQAAASLGLGLTTVKHLVASGELGSIRVGRRVLIPRSALHVFIERKQHEVA